MSKVKAPKLTDWREGLAAKAITGTEAKFAKANVKVSGIEALKLSAGEEMRIALRTYLKGSKARFALAAEELFSLGVSAAYEYVQAADAVKVFGPAVKATGTDPRTVGVRTWAKLDRYTGTAEAKTDGRAVIKAEAIAAKAEGRSAFTNAGLAATIEAHRDAKTEGTGTSAADRRVARIAKANRDSLRTNYAKAVAVAIEAEAKGTAPRDRVLYLAAVRHGIAIGAKDGAGADAAITRLALEWSQEDATAKAITEAKAKAPAEAPAAKPTVKLTAVKAGKRTAGNTGPLRPVAPKRAAKAPAAK